MGTLVSKNNLSLSPDWYFHDAYTSYDNRDAWGYQWPSPQFPYVLYIHCDTLRENKSLRCDIRKWIDARAVGTVIFEFIKKNYYIYRQTTDRDWARSIERTNVWMGLYFECPESTIAFKLQFNEHIRELSDMHPTMGDKYEETSYYKKNK